MNISEYESERYQFVLLIIQLYGKQRFFRWEYKNQILPTWIFASETTTYVEDR